MSILTPRFSPILAHVSIDVAQVLRGFYDEEAQRGRTVGGDVSASAMSREARFTLLDGRAAKRASSLLKHLR